MFYLLAAVLWFAVLLITFLVINGVSYWLDTRKRRQASYRRWRGAALLLLPLLLLMPAGGCASQGGADPQYQQFQAQVQFWTDEVARLRAAVDTLPPGKSRDDLMKQLTQAQYWLVFFDALVNPPRAPTTQPVKSV